MVTLWNFSMDRIILGDNDVISIQKDKSPVTALTFKANEIHIYLRDKISKDVGAETASNWVFEGLPCEVMTEDKAGWQSGKIWVSLEFMPDNKKENDKEMTTEPTKATPESPLDDLRAELLDEG
jgi:hypothetical protein